METWSTLFSYFLCLILFESKNWIFYLISTLISQIHIFTDLHKHSQEYDKSISDYYECYKVIMNYCKFHAIIS